MLIWSQIKQQAAILIERVDSAFLTKIDGFGNQIYTNVIDRRPWMAMLRQFQVPCVAGQNYVIMPQEMVQVIDVHQRETPIVMALQRYYNNLNKNIGGISNSGSPVSMNPMGLIGLKAAMPSDGTLTVQSDSASDVTQNIRIRGYDATTKLPKTELLLLTGTSAVTSTNSYSSAAGYEPQFSKDSATVGSITMKRSTTTIAEISPRDLTVRYMKWLMYPAPTQATVLYVTAKRRHYKLEYDEDVPEIECENCIIQGAYAMSLQKKRQFAKAEVEWQKFEESVAVLTGREPKFDENFNDQWYPQMNRDPLDLPYA